MLSQAIVEKKAVAFYYYRLDCRKRREFLNGDQEIVVFPETLFWHEDNYYLIAATEEWDHLHFRLDRMTDIRILDDVKRGERVYNRAELENYIQSSFSPETGKSVRITLRCDKNCAEEIFERFGNYVTVYGITDTHFKADISAAPGNRFYSWVFGMNGQVKILAPESVKKRMCELLSERYDE
jgi:predicted DNA-binding transcriptional regulator YafY